MTNELYRGDLSDVAKVYTTNGYLKVVQDKRKSGSLKSLYVKKQVTKDGIQARTGTCPKDYSYVVATTDINVDMDYLAFLINSFLLAFSIAEILLRSSFSAMLYLGITLVF